MKKLIVAIVFLCSTAAAFSQAQTQETIRTVDVTGEALILVVPDQASVTFGIETFDAALQKAQTGNAASGKRLLDAVKALGVEEKYIQTSDLTVTVQYKDSDHPSRGIEGYMASRAYTVTLKNPRILSTLVSSALASGANSVSGVSYSTTELRKYRDEARIQAVRAAREKAVAMAGELGCGIGLPRSVSEQAQQYYGAGMTQNVMLSRGNLGGEAGGDLPDTIPVGQIGIRATVHVTFDLTSK